MPGGKMRSVVGGLGVRNGVSDGGLFKKAGADLAFGGEQFFQLSTQRRIAGTLAVEEGRALRRRPFAWPRGAPREPAASVRESASCVLLSRISRCNHTRAVAQWRFTVAVERPSNCAVSSIERPPKKRNSTIWLCFGSSRARPVKASSKAIRSKVRPLAGAIASSKAMAVTAGAALGSVACALVTHENLAHEQGADGDEMLTILKLRCVVLLETQIGLMHQRSGLQSMARACLTQVLMRYLAQIIVQPGNQSPQSLVIAVAPLLQELADRRRNGRVHTILPSHFCSGRTIPALCPEVNRPRGIHNCEAISQPEQQKTCRA